jgi:hypothetical protein
MPTPENSTNQAETTPSSPEGIANNSTEARSGLAKEIENQQAEALRQQYGLLEGFTVEDVMKVAKKKLNYDRNWALETFHEHFPSSPNATFTAFLVITKLDWHQINAIKTFYILKPSLDTTLSALSQVAEIKLNKNQIIAFNSFCYSFWPSPETWSLFLPEIAKLDKESLEKLDLITIIKEKSIFEINQLRTQLESNQLPHEFADLKDFFKKTNYLDLAFGAQALRFVREFNYAHNETPSKRLEFIREWSPRLIYGAIVHGNSEIFTSTFNLLFDGNGHRGKEREYALLPKMKAEYSNGYEFLLKVDPRRETFRTFLRTCAQYNKLDDFLATMPAEQQQLLLTEFTSDIEKSKQPTQDAVAIAETLIYSLQNPVARKRIEEVLKSEYERLGASNLALANLLGLVGSATASGCASEDPAVYKWFKDLREKYPLPDLTRIEPNELFQENENIQQHFFYDDREGYENDSGKWDGHHSFRHFIGTYGGSVSWEKNGDNIEVSDRGKDGWRIEDRGSFVALEKQANGRKIKIFANKPDHEDDGPDEIQSEFEKMELKSIVVVHRGHSYHADKTIRRIPDIARVVNLGSCGGYNNIDSVLTRAPEAHILSTKGTGSMLVNDDLFKMINEQIISGGALVWPEVWEQARTHFEKRGGQSLAYFKNYIPPHENVATQIVGAWRKRKK